MISPLASSIISPKPAVGCSTEAAASASVGTGSASAEDLLSTGTALCQTANEAGLFLQDEASRDKVVLKRVRREMKDWLKSVRKQIDSLTPGEALSLLSTYDMAHRALYGIPADPDFLNKYTMAAFEARIRGNKEVDPYILYRRINAGLSRRDPLYFGRPLQWSTTILDRWYKDLTSYTHASSRIASPSASRIVSSSSTPKAYPSANNADSLYDLLSKASILMETDLWVYEGASQKAFKQRLFTSLRPSLYALPSSLDPLTRKALKTFLSSSRRYLKADLTYISSSDTNV